MTPAQCREAPVLIGWSQADLAKASVVVPEGVSLGISRTALG